MGSIAGVVRCRLTRPALLLAALVACLPAGPAGAAPGLVSLSAQVGIGGRYRPRAWFPITVTLTNRGPFPFAGQVQVVADEDPKGGDVAPYGIVSAVFARPVSVPPYGLRRVSLCVRNLDPKTDQILVQLVARGDGRVLAGETLTDPGRTRRTSGLEVPPHDLFLVGIGPTGHGFAGFNGQQWFLRHGPSGPVPAVRANWSPGAAGPNQPDPNAVVQMAVPGSLAELPDRAAGYGGVDAVLLRSDAPLGTLSADQVQALRGWVGGGGRLVVCLARNVRSLSPLAGLLPVRIGPAVMKRFDTRRALLYRLSLRPLPGVRALQQETDGAPLTAVGPYGAGQVVVTAFDPIASRFLDAYSLRDHPLHSQAPLPDEADFWRSLLTSGDSAPLSLVGYSADRDARGDGTTLAQTVLNAPAMDAPGIEVIGLFLLGYVLLLVPINYLVLKRLGRKEWAWGTVPVLVLLFAGGTYAVGFAAKGGSLFVNRAAFVETTAGQRTAGVAAAIGVFSPHHQSYDITLDDPRALVAVPATGGDSSRQDSAGSQPAAPTRLVQGRDGVTLQDTAIDMWAMRSFDVQTTADLGGAVDARLVSRNGQVSGPISNHTAYDLKECVFVAGNQVQSFGDLPAGVSHSVVLPCVPGVPAAISFAGITSAGARSGDNPVRVEIRRRLCGSLAMLEGSLGSSGSCDDYQNGASYPVPAFHAQPGEALLVGWSSDPALAGPGTRVDGRRAAENDMSLVVVHLPIAAR